MAILIDDEELRTVFKATSEEHLQNLDDGLLYLEKHPHDLAVLEALMREAHSLKGDANMLGLKEMATLAHEVEHLLIQLKEPRVLLSSDRLSRESFYERLAYGIATIRKLVHEAVTGESSGINPFQALARLAGAGGCEERGVENQEIEEKAVESIRTTDSNTVEKKQREADNPPLQSPTLQVTDRESPSQLPLTLNSPYYLETIRVGTRNLDALMTQAGELTVTQIRITHRLGQMGAIANLWEEWNRDLFVNQMAFDRIQQDRGAVQRVESFYHRTKQRLEELGQLVKTLRSGLLEDSIRLGQLSGDLEEGIRTLRLLPFSTLFNAYPRLVRDLARQEGKSVELVLVGGDTLADKRLLEGMKDPLIHILRNAIDHGIELPDDRQRQGKSATATIQVTAYQTATNIVLEVSDDGCGLDIDKIKQTALKRGIYQEAELATMTVSQIQASIFAPGFSTAPLVTEVSGRGVGLDVVKTNVDRLKGAIEVKSQAGQGCTLRIALPMTLATTQVLIVTVNNRPYAIPVEYVQIACRIRPEEIFPLEGHDTIVRNSQPIPIVQLVDLLELPSASSEFAQKAVFFCIILQVGQHQLGILVDGLVDEQEVMMKPLSHLLKRVRNISGATILGTGEVCMVLNPQDLIKSARSLPPIQRQPIPSDRSTILLIEDSLTIRTQEKRILEAAGYQVITAVDGVDGFKKLRSNAVDAIVSDVQMPNLDGLELTTQIRRYQEYRDLPIILVTSLASDEDKRRGVEAGANAYLTKSSFSQDILLSTLKRFV